MPQPKNPSRGAVEVAQSPTAPGSPPPPQSKPLPLPHEMDQSATSVARTPDPKMIQAKRDLDAGMVDTDMRATPGLDAALRKEMVPGAGGKPPPDGH